MINRVRSRGIRAYYFDGDIESCRHSTTSEWHKSSVILRAFDTGSKLPEIAKAAQSIRSDNLDVLFYPEVGLTTVSRWLSTQRLARVQATGYGHPVTTGSSVIDYFVGGKHVEKNPDQYSERLVLLPKLGVASTVPPEPSGPRVRSTDTQDVRIANLSSRDKFNAELLKTWNNLLVDSNQVSLNLFPGTSVHATQKFANELSTHLPEANINLTPKVSRQHCIDFLRDSDLYLDSYPYGGYNTIVEALACGCPVVTMDGEHACGRFGAAILRLLDMPEFLIAKNSIEYINAARRLILEPTLRHKIRKLLQREHVISVLCNQEEMSQHFEEAITWMQSQAADPSRKSIRISTEPRQQSNFKYSEKFHKPDQPNPYPLAKSIT